MLIAIFILLLIGVVAIALVVSSGTESALAGNYRASTDVYYAAVGGLEEVRSRLRPNSPNYFGTTDPTFLPPGAPLGVCSPIYVINALPGEIVTPWDPANPYYDSEFSKEFPIDCGGAPPPSPSPNAASIWNRNPLNGLVFPGPLYKWVRINGVTEQSLNIDTCNYDTTVDAKLLYYGVAPSTTAPCNPNPPNLSVNDAGIGSQVLEITALAVLPSGSQNSPTQKLLQYLIAPFPITLPQFTATLTLVSKPGNNLAFSAPTSNGNYKILGNDQDAVGGCIPGPSVDAVGVFTNVDQSNFINGGNGGTGIPPANRSKYTGSFPAPDVSIISAPPPSLQSPTQLEALMQTVIQNADVVIPSGPATFPLPTVDQAALSAATSGMNSSNPMTVVVNGNLDLTGWHNTGYGLLLVRGNLNYDPDASWDGIVMVVGQGTVTGSLGGVGEIDGALLLAKTLDAGGGFVLPNFGTATVLFGPNMGGNGMRYSSCWVQASQPLGGIKVLSFHEISQ